MKPSTKNNNFILIQIQAVNAFDLAKGNILQLVATPPPPHRGHVLKRRDVFDALPYLVDLEDTL